MKTLTKYLGDFLYILILTLILKLIIYGPSTGEEILHLEEIGESASEYLKSIICISIIFYFIFFIFIRFIFLFVNYLKDRFIFKNQSKITHFDLVKKSAPSIIKIIATFVLLVYFKFFWVLK